MSVRDEVTTFLARWAKLTAARDFDRTSDLFLRDPAPLVIFSDGERSDDWLDVRIRLERDLSRVVIERIDAHDVTVRELDDATLIAAFTYDMHVRDMWGTASAVVRRATMTLLRTKDGLRIASAHFSRAE